jgi:hypothetical protein
MVMTALDLTANPVGSRWTPVKTVAIVSPFFPPSTLAGVHRARHLAKHLPRFGWHPIIVRVHERHYTERLDPGLEALVPADVVQMRTAAIPAFLARRFGIGDVGLRGFTSLRDSLTAAVRRSNAAAVLITGSPFYPMLLARHARETLNVPVVLDFQDPWVSAQGEARARFSKGGLAHRLAVALEPRALRHADFITSVSERQNDEMAARYPWLDRLHMAAIPIGGDPGDFEALRRNPPFGGEVRLDPAMINLSYVGTFLPRAGPVVEVLFSALADLRAERPSISRRLRLNFVGTSNQTDGAGQHRIAPLATAAGVSDLVTEVPQRIPYLDALSLLANSNGLLMIGSDEPHYTASKIYPNLMASRPFISIFCAASSAHTMLSQAGGGRAFGFANAAELRCLRQPLKSALAALIDDPEPFGRPDPAICAPFHAQAVAGQFAAVLDRLLTR